MALLASSLFGSAVGFGLGGNGRSAALGAAAGYALNKLTHHKPLFGGGCESGSGHSPETGLCIKVGGPSHKSLKYGYSQRQTHAMHTALNKAREMGYSEESPQMRRMISDAIRENK